MAGSAAKTLNVADLEAAVSAAVEHIKSQKLSGLPALQGSIIAGRYIRETTALHPDAERGLKQAADAVTKQVNAQNPALNASSIVEAGLGHIILGIIFREQ